MAANSAMTRINEFRLNTAIAAVGVGMATRAAKDDENPSSEAGRGAKPRTSLGFKIRQAVLI
jgi:hypothetical protein